MATVTKPIALDESFHTTETPSRNIADVLASLGDAISQGAQPVTKKLATNSFKTINGGLVDGLTVQFTPIQDLHGYSKPWAGGAGKNLIPMTVANLKTLNISGTWSDNRYTFANGAIIDVLTDTDGNVIGIKGSGTHNASSQFNFNLGNVDFASGVTYTLNGITDGSNSTYRLNVQGISNYTSGENTIAGDGSTHLVRVAIQPGYSPMDFTIYPMIRLATIADPTFEPYSNICPISGHTDVESYLVGRNRLNNTASSSSIRGIDYTVNADGTVDADGLSTQNGGRVVFADSLPSGNYILNGSNNGSASTYCIRYNINGGTNINVYSGDSGIITLTDTDVLTVEIRVYQGATLSHVLFKPMIRLATDANPAYEPYNGRTYTTSLGGTEYGGDVEQVSGTGKSEWANIASYAGESITEPWLSSLDEYIPNTTPSTGAQVCYKLATSTALTLTGQNITAEVGVNNVSAPLTGQSIKTDSVIYKDMFTWEDVLKVI